MKVRKKKAWQHEITGVDGNTQLFGVNIFNCDWKSTGDKADVYDPLYNQSYRFPIYTVFIEDIEYKFVAGEFSNCVWGFFILK